ACAAALQAPPADAARLRAIAGAVSSAASGRWLAEHEIKAVLRAAGLPVVPGRTVVGEEDAAAALAELGAPVAVKRSSPALRHKTAAGALRLGLADEPGVR